jgi:hypothetical protein
VHLYELKRRYLHLRNENKALKPQHLYEFQSDVADNYDYDPNYEQADHGLDDDGEDVKPATER